MTELEFIKRRLERTGSVPSASIETIAQTAIEAAQKYREIVGRMEPILTYDGSEDRYVCTEVPAWDLYELLKRGKRVDVGENLRRELEKDGHPA